MGVLITALRRADVVRTSVRLPTVTPRGTTKCWISGEDAVEKQSERSDEDRATEHLVELGAAGCPAMM